MKAAAHGQKIFGLAGRRRPCGSSSYDENLLDEIIVQIRFRLTLCKGKTHTFATSKSSSSSLVKNRGQFNKYRTGSCRLRLKSQR